MENENFDAIPQPVATSPYIDPQKVSIKGVVIKYSIISGLLTIIASLSFNLTGISKPGGSMGANLVPMLVNIGIFVFAYGSAFRDHRDQELGGYITLGRCMKIGIFISLITGVVAGLFTVIYMHFVDPNMIQDAMNLQMAEFEKKGMSDEEIQQAMKIGGMMQNPIVLLIFSVFGTAIFGLIGSLILGLFIKKDPKI